MLLHRQVLRAQFRTMVLSTIFVGSIFFIVVGFALYGWITTRGQEHVELLQSMAIYTNVVASESEIVIPDKYSELAATDPRTSALFLKKVAAVKSFFNRHNAPLVSNSEDFVRAADMYGLDYRLLPAISMIESSGGKSLFKPHNPFGWGRSGYPTFTAAIFDVARGMSNYYKGGLHEPERIAYRYNPVTPESWGRKCRTFMNQMPAL